MDLRSDVVVARARDQRGWSTLPVLPGQADASRLASRSRIGRNRLVWFKLRGLLDQRCVST